MHCLVLHSYNIFISLIFTIIIISVAFVNFFHLCTYVILQSLISLVCRLPSCLCFYNSKCICITILIYICLYFNIAHFALCNYFNYRFLHFNHFISKSNIIHPYVYSDLITLFIYANFTSFLRCIL